MNEKNKDVLFGSVSLFLSLVLFFGFLYFCLTSLKEREMESYIEDYKPENLNILCQEYSESYYKIIDEYADISSISRDDAYKTKLAMQINEAMDNYEKMLDYWSDLSNNERKVWASEGDNPTIIISHTVDHACEPYWNYKNVVEPELNRIIDASPAKTTL